MAQTETQIGAIVRKVTDGQNMKNMQKKCNKCKKVDLKRQDPCAFMPAAAAPSHSNKEAPLTLPSASGYVGYWYKINSFGISQNTIILKICVSDMTD